LKGGRDMNTNVYAAGKITKSKVNIATYEIL